jgi:hypothetical protein
MLKIHIPPSSLLEYLNPQAWSVLGSSDGVLVVNEQNFVCSEVKLVFRNGHRIYITHNGRESYLCKVFSFRTGRFRKMMKKDGWSESWIVDEPPYLLYQRTKGTDVRTVN